MGFLDRAILLGNDENWTDIQIIRFAEDMIPVMPPLEDVSQSEIDANLSDQRNSASYIGTSEFGFGIGYRYRQAPYYYRRQ